MLVELLYVEAVLSKILQKIRKPQYDTSIFWSFRDTSVPVHVQYFIILWLTQLRFLQ